MPPIHAPLSRPIEVADIPPDGLEVDVAADEAERRALAEDFGIRAVHRLGAHYRLRRVTGGVRVDGTVSAEVEQTCVVTLEPVTGPVSETVELMFSEHAGAPEEAGDVARMGERDPPEPIVGGRIDLGAVTTEFLALGLDPYPRKPGVSYEPEPGRDPADSPFAALAKMKKS